MSDEDPEAAVDYFPDAVCPLCESGAAIRVPASMVGKSHDFILCYACGRTSVVEGENTVHG